MRSVLLATMLAAVAVAGCGSVSATGHATAVTAVTPAQLATEAPVQLSSPLSGPPSPPPPPAARTAAPTPPPVPTQRPAPPASRPPAPKPPPPPPASRPPAPKPPPPPPAACHPLTSGGNCYEPGEFCRDADHGATGLAGDGKVITCEDNDGWRWEPQ